MNNEETIIGSNGNQEQNLNMAAEQNSSMASEPKSNKSNFAEKAAFLAGGAVLGGGMAMAGQAVAANTVEKAYGDDKDAEKDPSDDNSSADNNTETEQKNDDTSEQALASTATEDNKENQKEDQKTEEHTADANHEHESANAIPPEEDSVTVESNGTTVRVIGEAEIDVVNGDIHVSTGHNEQPEQQQSVVIINNPQPEPEEVIVISTPSAPVAHVSDNVSFAQAFADARAQVGAGGVFEWRGGIYGTYYKTEWDSMSAAERAQYQASVQNDLAHGATNVHSTDVHHGGALHNTAYTVPTPQAEGDSEMNVEILDMGMVDVNGDGVDEYGVLLDVDGNEILVLDMNNDNIADIAMCDANYNDEIEDDEVVVITDEQLEMPMEEYPSDDYVVGAGDVDIDYTNDANVELYDV